MSVLVGKKAPLFTAQAVFGQEIREIKLSQYHGKYLLLFFYPLDFTFVCPTEIHAFQKKLTDFKERNVELLGCSVDSPYTHQAWLRTPKEKGGIQGVEYGLIADLGGKIARDYDILKEDEQVAYRAAFLIDKDGFVRHQIVNELALGRNIQEELRIIDALQYSEKHGAVCPANWEQGKTALKPTAESVSEYLKKEV